MSIDSYMTVSRRDAQGKAQRLCAITLRASPAAAAGEAPKPAEPSLGAALNRVIHSVVCPAYAVVAEQEGFEQMLKAAGRMAGEPVGGLELVWRKGRGRSLGFSRRIWQRVGGFNEALAGDEAWPDFAGRVVTLRECMAVEIA